MRAPRTKDIVSWPFRLMGTGLKYLLLGYTTKSTSGASFAPQKQYREFLNASNRGLLLDGVDLRLSERDSFQNVALMARVGTGKTTRYVVPNVLDKARTHCSMVINDPKGEVFALTSGYMQKRGFKVITIDPEDLTPSSRFNPLMEARELIELEQIAEILVRSGLPSSSGKDDFWLQGAIRFVSLFIKCLKHAGEENPAWFNLHNLYYLFQNFGEDGHKLDDFMSRYTIYPDHPDDESLWNEWKGVLTGNPEGIQSFVLNAITALKALSNPRVGKLTARSDFSLEDMRKEKTVIYVITPAQHAEYYSFLTSLFFRSVFNACMRRLPDRKTLPVYVLYDEFGHSTIPNFVSTANTIRGYKVSLSIILQSVSQLNARYGKDYADSIQGGFNTYLTYSAADPQTASFFEGIIGKVRERQKLRWDEPRDEYREYNLLNANEIRTIGDYEALIVSGNRQPIKVTATPFFENWGMRRKSAHPPATTTASSGDDRLEYVRL